MTEVVMPQMGESITEGTLTRWLKKPGDRVERDEPLFEISTDKVDTEIPSPAAGVITTSPATAPEQKPSTLAWRRMIHSRAAQVKAPTAAARVVVVKAWAATPSAARADPALKPYQPTHSMPVPTIVSVMLCGRKEIGRAHV